MLHPPIHRLDTEPGPLLSVTTVADPRPGRVVVEVVGELDTCTAPALDVCLQSQASRPGVCELVVFLGQVRFLGAAGVRVLAHADRRCRARGARLVLRTGARRCVLRPLQLAGLTDLVAVDPVDDGRTARRGRRTSLRRPRRVCR